MKKCDDIEIVRPLSVKREKINIWQCHVDYELEKTTGYAACVHVLDIPDSDPISHMIRTDLFNDHIFIVRESATFRHFSVLKGCFIKIDEAAQVARKCCKKALVKDYNDEKYQMVELFDETRPPCYCIYDRRDKFIVKAIGSPSLPKIGARIPPHWSITNCALYVVDLWWVQVSFVNGK